jgi:ribose-phosphate pyrophosphokinase
VTPRFYALSDSLELGKATAQEAGIELSALEERNFESGEFRIRPLTSVRDRPAYVLQTLAGSLTKRYSYANHRSVHTCSNQPGITRRLLHYRPDSTRGALPYVPLLSYVRLLPDGGIPVTRSTADRLLRLLFLLAGLGDAGANQRVAVIPYLAYVRADRRVEPGDPVNMRYVAQLLEASGATHVVILDVHNASALDNAFRIKTDHLTAIPMMADHVATRFGSKDLTVVSPDIGGLPRAHLFHEVLEGRLGRPVKMAFVEKRRISGEACTGRFVGESDTRDAVIVDDICATGATLVHAAERCRGAGAKDVHVAVTHTPCSAGLKAVLACSAVTGVVSTDSVGTKFELTRSERDKLFTLPVAPLLGRAIDRLVKGQSIVPQLTYWPVAPCSWQFDEALGRERPPTFWRG